MRGMLHTVRVRLSSPLMGDKIVSVPGETELRVFRRAEQLEGDRLRLPADVDRWRWAFCEARDSLGFGDVNIGAIIPATHYEAPKSPGFYTRNFSRAGRPASERFEHLKTGTNVDWVFTVASELPPHEANSTQWTRPPDADEFLAMLAHIGEHLGMSWFGNEYGYGRFTIRTP